MAVSRRSFLVSASAALAAHAQDAVPRSANDTIEVGLIGSGIMGSADGDTAHSLPGVKVRAVADVYQGRLDAARERYGADIFTTRDYRELLNRKEIDAVIVAVPDHWHAAMSVDAMKAGKDVYCQKPMVQRVDEGQRVVEMAKETGRMLQVGSQGVSGLTHAKARDLIRSGMIGKVNLIETSNDRFSSQGAWQYTIPPDATPENIDWDRFLGRAPKRPFEPVRLFRWRNYQDYGTGIAGDLFVHQFNSIHFLMDSLGPNRIMSSGGLHHWKDGRDVPDLMTAMLDYPETARHPAFHVVAGVNFVSGGGASGRGWRIIGDEGAMIMGNQGITITKQPKEKDPGYMIDSFTKAMRERVLTEHRAKYPVPDPIQGSEPVQELRFARRGEPDQIAHHKAWIKAIRTRQQPVENAEFGFRAAAPALLCNTSYFERKVCNWDPVAMKAV